MAPETNPAQRVPLDGVIHARYAGASKTLTLAQSYLRLPQTWLDMNGTISDRSALQLRLAANDLHELETISNLFRKPSSGEPTKPLGLYGTANFNGAVRGSTAAPELSGLLQASNLRIKGSSWRVLRTNVLASPSVASLQNGELDLAGRGHIKFNLKAGLHQWSFTPNSPIEVTLDAAQIDLADLAKAAGSTTPVMGTLSANLRAHGSELNPQGQGQISLSNAKVAGETIQAANANFNGTGDALHTTVELRIPAGSQTRSLRSFLERAATMLSFTPMGSAWINCRRSRRAGCKSQAS